MMYESLPFPYTPLFQEGLLHDARRNHSRLFVPAEMGLEICDSHCNIASFRVYLHQDIVGVCPGLRCSRTTAAWAETASYIALRYPSSMPFHLIRSRWRLLFITSCVSEEIQQSDRKPADVDKKALRSGGTYQGSSRARLVSVYHLRVRDGIHAFP